MGEEKDNLSSLQRAFISARHAHGYGEVDKEVIANLSSIFKSLSLSGDLKESLKRIGGNFAASQLKNLFNPTNLIAGTFDPSSIYAQLSRYLELNEQWTSYGASLASSLEFYTPDFPKLKEISRETQKILAGLSRSFNPELLKHISELKNQNLLPENLRSIACRYDKAKIESNFLPFLRDGGIGIYGIPRNSTVFKLVEASPKERRNVMWAHRRSIITDCEEVLEDSSILCKVPEAPLALEALRTMQSGFFPAAQSLCSVLLDTLSTRLLKNNKEASVRVKNVKPDQAGKIPDFLKKESLAKSISEMKSLIAWLPFCAAHTAYYANKGDQIPRNYNRHASIHGASKKQYVKRNSLQALMLATSLIFYSYREQPVSL